MSVHAFPTRDSEYREPTWPKLRVRCLRPFYWRDEVRRGAYVVVLRETYQVNVGDELDVIEPEARSLVGAGRAELFIPRAAGRIAPNGGFGGTVDARTTVNIDMRGATQEAAQTMTKALPEILRRNNDALESKIVQRLRSGKYGNA